MLAATLEQKVWINLGGKLYPNLYTFLIGNPGLGKSRSITAASNVIREALPEIFFGSVSMTRASLSDHMNEAKRFIAMLPNPPMEYNSLVAIPDEFSAFMNEYDSALVSSLVEFYDVNPYSEGRRVANIRIKIPSPQLNMLTGSTPSNLIHTLKDFVWEQGLMSRVIMIYAYERPTIDTFNTPPAPKPINLIHDIKVINTILGEFSFTKEYATAMQNWKVLGLTPVPEHPKLRHYCTRRWAHALKLAMIASIDRGNDLTLRVEDFNCAMNWLLEAEGLMPNVFKEGSVTPDSRIMDEVAHFVRQHPGAVSEHLILNFLRQRASVMAIRNIMEAMQQSKMLICHSVDKKGNRLFTAPRKD